MRSSKVPEFSLAFFAALFIAQLGVLPGGANAADSEAQLKALDLQCEQAREARLKPLRDAEIAKCKASKRNDPEYCERYWRDYGYATRLPNGSMKPRMFDDLPECITAFKARQGQVKE